MHDVYLRSIGPLIASVLGCIRLESAQAHMTIITGLLFEMISPSLGPMWSALAVGYVVIGLNGQVYLTNAGAEYLAWVGA
jgi:hypothetical protein